MLQGPLAAGLPRTPLAAFAALSAQRRTFWLDSGDAPSAHGRYHHLGCEPRRWLAESDLDPFAVLRDWVQPGPAGLRPAVCTIALIAYDLGRFADSVVVANDAEVGPELIAATYDACVTYDLATGDAWLTADSVEAKEALEARLSTPARAPLTIPSADVATDRDAPRYAALVEAVRDHIARGDVYQVNLSQRFEATFAAPPHAPSLYRALRQRSAPYGAYVDADDTTILSNSPEGFLHLDLRPGARTATTWPLKGTRAHSGNPDELRAAEKDRAEHVMIVDLERNDLGRLAVPGSVRVPRLFDVVTYPTVLHLESEVTAVIRDGLGLPDVLAALFPGGSVTGAPKLAATALIAELEGRRRGLYCGAIGALDVDGLRSTWSIPIRTAVLTGNHLVFRSGGGIVADSTGEAEWAETLVKARALLELCGVPTGS